MLLVPLSAESSRTFCPDEKRDRRVPKFRGTFTLILACSCHSKPEHHQLLTCKRLEVFIPCENGSRSTGYQAGNGEKAESLEYRLKPPTNTLSGPDCRARAMIGRKTSASVFAVSTFRTIIVGLTLQTIPMIIERHTEYI